MQGTPDAGGPGLGGGHDVHAAVILDMLCKVPLPVACVCASQLPWRQVLEREGVLELTDRTRKPSWRRRRLA
eukprot:7704972-Lingulodinium_polyedra.AAC.1